MRIIDRVLQCEEFREKPPVLVDIGASGRVHAKWAPIARYSTCVAFDPDEREMATVRTESGLFRKMHVYNRAVSAEAAQTIEFYLTRSPFCSSVLRPAHARLANWRFAGLFEVERTVTVPAISLTSALAGLDLDYVDWLKCDTQGTDLRLLRSLGEPLLNRLLAAELEPGIIEAYEGEDDLGALLSFMKERPFWLSAMDVKGTQRIRADTMRERFGKLEQRFLGALLRASPGWAEVVYLNSFEKCERLGKREYLLGWVFAVVEQQYGYAVELATAGEDRFGDAIFADLRGAAVKRARRSGYLRMPGRAVRAVLRKTATAFGVR